MAAGGARKGAGVEELRLRTDGLTWREIDGEVIVLDLDQSVYLATNATGALLWDALAAGTTREALIELVVGRFEIARETAAQDVDDFLQLVSDRGLLVRSPSSGG